MLPAKPLPRDLCATDFYHGLLASRGQRFPQFPVYTWEAAVANMSYNALQAELNKLEFRN